MTTSVRSDGRTDRYAKTHLAIINVAGELFYQNGVNTTGVNTICAEAGVTKATLYSHFPSKDILIAECLRVLDTRYYDWFVRRVSQRSSDPDERIRIVFEVLDEWFHNESFRGCAFMNASVELAEDEHPGRAEALAHKVRTVDYLEQLARDANIARPRSFAKQLMLLMEGAIITAVVQEDPNAARTAGAMAAALLAQAQRSEQITAN